MRFLKANEVVQIEENGYRLMIGNSVSLRPHLTEEFTAFFAACANGEFESSRYCQDLLLPEQDDDFWIIAQTGHIPLEIRGKYNETPGRLNYISGCSSTVLIGSPRLGDPVLNFLYLPENVDQTMHTHPSARIGIITHGRGYALWYDGDNPVRTELTPGMVWIIEKDEPHNFVTDPGETLGIIAYHPDSDFGPTDEVHPMLNRTIIDGVSARRDA